MASPGEATVVMVESPAGRRRQHRRVVQAQIPARGGGEGGRGSPPEGEAERQLNGFARSVVVIERVGNAIGTLAFTWATVVLLGGYPTKLSPKRDFRFATAIVFLEAARMFSRNNRMDYLLFFGTRGAFRRLGWNELVVTLCLSSLLISVPGWGLSALVIVLVVDQSIRPGLLRAPAFVAPLLRVVSLCSPLVAMLALDPFITTEKKNPSIAIQMGYIALLVMALLVTVSKMKFPSIIRLVDRSLGNKQVFWRRFVLSLCMIDAIVIFLSGFDGSQVLAKILTIASTMAFVSFGNLQIPAAAARVVLPLLRLTTQGHFGDDGKDSGKINFAPTIKIFYWMVLGQGIFYLSACLVEIFSIIPQKFLAHRVQFRGHWGVEFVSLYYAYALEKCMERDVLAPKKISLSSFAIDSLNSDSPKMQLHGIRVMHNLLQREPTRTQLFPKLKASTKTVARIIRMLDSTSPENTTTCIRLFAAKVSTEIATSLRVITIPGIVQVVSALLDNGNEHRRNPILDTYEEQEEKYDLILNVTGNQDENQEAAPHSNDLNKRQECSTQQVGTTTPKSWIIRCKQRITKFWSVSPEEPLTEYDLLPALGMSILEGLANCDQDNCVEISRSSSLIWKIIGFTCNTSNNMYSDAQRKVLRKSSLKLLNRLTSIGGEIGVTLRHKILKHPFFLRNLMEILRDSTSSQELSKLVAGTLRNLAIDGNAREAIGRIQVIMNRLMLEFLSPDREYITNDDPLLRKVAGQALAMLAMDSVNNCLAMLRETAYEFVKELTSMIHLGRYRCVAASLLRSICLHAQQELKDSDLKELSYCLREVLEGILVADRAELYILIGLSSQISKVIPQHFAQELEEGQIKVIFIKRLVDTLNANMEPSTCCPGIRRVILEQAINMMDYDTHYVSCFKYCRMAEVLSMVEETALDAENYSLFLGDAGLMEACEPLSSLMARAKLLLDI